MSLPEIREQCIHVLSLDKVGYKLYIYLPSRVLTCVLQSVRLVRPVLDKDSEEDELGSGDADVFDNLGAL